VYFAVLTLGVYQALTNSNDNKQFYYMERVKSTYDFVSTLRIMSPSVTSLVKCSKLLVNVANVPYCTCICHPTR